MDTRPPHPAIRPVCIPPPFGGTRMPIGGPAPPVFGSQNSGQTPLRSALPKCRGQVALVGLVSGIVNLLQLSMSIYMMQVFDRVLATRVLDTLLYLSLMVMVAILVMAVLDAVRGHVMQRLAAWVEHRV